MIELTPEQVEAIDQVLHNTRGIYDAYKRRIPFDMLPGGEGCREKLEDVISWFDPIGRNARLEVARKELQRDGV